MAVLIITAVKEEVRQSVTRARGSGRMLWSNKHMTFSRESVVYVHFENKSQTVSRSYDKGSVRLLQVTLLFFCCFGSDLQST